MKKHPWAARREEFWPISTNALPGFVGNTKMVNLKLCWCLGYRVIRV